MKQGCVWKIEALGVCGELSNCTYLTRSKERHQLIQAEDGGSVESRETHTHTA